MLNWQAGLMAGSCGGSSDDPSTGSRMHCSHACCTGCRHGSCNLSHLKLSHIKMITCAGSILYTWYTISSQHPSGACLFCGTSASAISLKGLSGGINSTEQSPLAERSLTCHHSGALPLGYTAHCVYTYVRL